MPAPSFTDAAALSAALLTLRPRARASFGERYSANVAGLGEVTWLCTPAAAGLPVGSHTEVVGATLSEAIPEGVAFNAQAFVDLLPEEMVPGKVSVSATRERIGMSFRVQPGHFRCRDCRWGDATDARGTHPGCCADCSARRTEGVRRAHLRGPVGAGS